MRTVAGLIREESVYQYLVLHLARCGCCSCPSLGTDSVLKPDQAAGNGTSPSIRCSTAPHIHSRSRQPPVARPVADREGKVWVSGRKEGPWYVLLHLSFTTSHSHNLWPCMGIRNSALLSRNTSVWICAESARRELLYDAVSHSGSADGALRETLLAVHLLKDKLFISVNIKNLQHNNTKYYQVTSCG